ncbi:MAG TPA: hypothetical protein VF494_03535 [Candidatus Limnocylindrales bacterium]
MTSQRPERPEPFDAFETRLATRVTRHSERGVRPIDAGRIAQLAAVAGGGAARARRGGVAPTLLGRIGWLLAGAALAAGLIGGASWAGGNGLLGAAPTPSPTLVAVAPTRSPAPSSAPTPASTEPPSKACQLANLSAKIADWTGAAGNRVATVVLGNVGAGPCVLVAAQRPQLVDGTGAVLIDGTDPTNPGKLTLARGEAVTTEVDVANYCGATPTAPVTLAFVFANGERLTAQARNASDTFGLPECMGPGGPGMITMYPWAP